MNAKITGIKNVVFDLGGVVIDLNRLAAVEGFEELGMHDANTFLDQYCQKGTFLDIETGRITAAEFFDTIRQHIGNETIKDKEIEDAFNRFLVDLPVARLRKIRELRERGKRVFALSNTNAVMYNSWIARQFRNDGFAINDYFEGIVTSFAEGVCKPNRRIFEILIERYNLEPSETLFLDDSAANCESAQQLGIRTACIGAPEIGDMLEVVALID
jgi:putative hydrolase of the HAD superfamily